MTDFRVKFWGRSRLPYHLDCETLQQAQEFYDRLDGMAEIQKYDKTAHAYEMIIPPHSSFNEGV